MKKIIFLLLVAFFGMFGASAQAPVIYTKMTAAGYEFKYLKIDSGLLVPSRDTLVYRNANQPGIIVYKPGAGFFGYNGINWRPLVGVDTTSLSNRINTKLNIVDTANIRFRPIAGSNVTLSGTYPNITINAASQSTDTSSLSNRINQKLDIADTANVRVRLSAGTNITSISGTYPNLTINAGNQSTDTSSLSNRINQKLNITDTANIRFRPVAGTNITLSGTYPNITFNATSTTVDTSSISNRIDQKLNIADTANKWVTNVTSLNDSSFNVSRAGSVSTITIKAAGSATNARRLVTQVYNNTGTTIAKGSVVYINGRHSSNLPTIALAQANDEANSYKTFALVENDIPTSNSGTVIQAGNIGNLNLPTSTYTDGDILYLSPTVAGGYTTTKPLAPDHICKLGSVTRAHPTFGSIEIKIENGWELAEMSDVQLSNVPADSALLQFSRVDSLWHDRTITQAIGPYLNLKANIASPTFTGNVGIGNTPASTAVLDIASTSRGLLIPRMSTSNRNAIASPATGLMVWNTTDSVLNHYNGNRWRNVGITPMTQTTMEALTNPGLGEQVYNTTFDAICTYTNDFGWWSNEQPWLSANGFMIFDEFITYSYGNNQNGNFFQIQNSNGTWTTAAPLGNRPGILQMSTGTNAAGRLTVQADGIGVSDGVRSNLLGGGKIVYEATIQIPTLSASAQAFHFFTGLSSVNTTIATNSVAFLYDSAGTNAGSAAIGRWQVVCANASNRSYFTTDSTVVAGRWYKLRFEVNAAGNSVDFYINGTLVRTTATNIPTGSITPITSIIKTNGTTARTAWIDYIRMRQKFTNSR